MIDNSGIPHTCPSIDEALQCVKWARFDLKYAIDNPDEDISSMESALYNLESLSSLLEDLRGSNSVLREYAAEMYEKCQSLEDEVDQLTLKIEYLT